MPGSFGEGLQLNTRRLRRQCGCPSAHLPHLLLTPGRGMAVTGHTLGCPVGCRQPRNGTSQRSPFLLLFPPGAGVQAALGISSGWGVGPYLLVPGGAYRLRMWAS